MISKKYKLFIGIFLLFILFALLSNAKYYSEICLEGILAWATILLPTLLPFFFFSKIFSQLNFLSVLSNAFSKITNSLYKTSGISAYVFFISCLSGYPVGSKVLSDIYEQGLLTKEEVKKTASFTSNSGPMFIIGSVGIGMLHSKTAGLIILFSHFFGALINGLLYRNIKVNKYDVKTFIENKNNENIINESMVSAINSIFIVGGFVAIFYVISNIFISYNFFYPITYLANKLFGIDINTTNVFLSGVLEMTNGCLQISTSILSLRFKTIFACALITFGGISTIFQAMAFLKKCGLSYSSFIKQKITHCIISTILCYFTTLIFL